MPIEAGYLVPHPPLIIPQVGEGMEKKVENTTQSFKKFAKEVKASQPDTILIITPHAPLYMDYFQISKNPKNQIKGDFSNFGVPEVVIQAEIDEKLSEDIKNNAFLYDIDAGFLGEQQALDHGSLVPLYFLQKENVDVPVVRLSISGFSLSTHYKYGKAIARAIEESGKKVVVIISGDLSHRLDKTQASFSKDGVKFDQMVKETFETGEFEKLLYVDSAFLENAAECGLRPLVMWMGMMDGYNVESEWYSYEAPYGVGYGFGKMIPAGKEERRKYFDLMIENKQRIINEQRENESELVKIARITLENYIKSSDIEAPDCKMSSKWLDNKAGVFVTLTKDGRLRGCIGTLEPTQENIVKEVMQNAISAGTRDNRFSPVEESELEYLNYSVDVLDEAEKVIDISCLDVKKYGIIVERGMKRGVLLPNLDTVHTVEDQIAIALEKAGISAMESYDLYRFQVVRYY